MARVFVSYASQDSDLASQVRRWIGDGHEVFLDLDPREGIALGEQWRQTLLERLRWADAVVCVVTRAAVASAWCTAEIVTAQERGSRLLPLRAEPALTHPLLTEVQHADITQNPAEACAALMAVLRRIDAVGGMGWPDGRSPFPGLDQFDSDRHRVFFGRAGEVKQLAELMRSIDRGSALLVAGPTGCGKSSLVRAGLVPVMAAEPGWRVLRPILPGVDPVGELARALAFAAQRIGRDQTMEDVRRRFDENDFVGLADDLLLTDPEGPQRWLLVVVDQLEELFTQTSPQQRARFAELLRPALAGSVRVVGTLRSEFLDQWHAEFGLATQPQPTYMLGPLRREALPAVIVEPARLAGIGLEDGLVARLVEDTDTGEALPLLAFTLARLADGVRRGGQLSIARYEELGGVQGALTSQADKALDAALATGHRSRQEVIAGLLRLVTVDGQGRPARRRVLRGELPDVVATELDAFVECRLLTTGTSDDTVVIGVAHETFLSAWQPLAEAIAAKSSALRAQVALELAATSWDGEGRPRNGLWDGGQLAAAVADTGARISVVSAPPPARQGWTRWLPRLHRVHRVLVTDRVDIAPGARDFLYASIRRDRYRRRRLVTGLSVLLVLAVAGAVVAILQQREAQKQQRIATARQLIAQADASRDVDPRTALLLGIAAEVISPSGETQAGLVSTLTTTRYAGALVDHIGPVTSVAFSSDGHTLATGDSRGTVTLSDLAYPAQRSSVAHTGSVSSVAFSPDGRTLATGSIDGRTLLWDLASPAQPRQSLVAHTGSVSSVAFSPDGRTLATASFDGPTTLWNLADLTRPRQLGSSVTGQLSATFSVAFSPDGHTLATGHSDGTVTLWDLARPARPRQSWAAHARPVNSVVFAPSGRTLATASDDGTVMAWDVTDVARPARLGSALTGHTGRVSAVAFTPSGHTLATASDDGTVMAWDVTDVARPARLGSALTGHTGRVSAVAFTPSGDTLATAGSDGTVIRWHLTDRVAPRPLGPSLTGQPGPVESVMFVSGGRTLASTSSDGTMIRRDLADLLRPRFEQSGSRSSPVDYLAVSPDGKTGVRAGKDGSGILEDLTDRTSPRSLGQPLAGHRSLVVSAAFTGDGRTMVTGGQDGSVVLWDLTDRTSPRSLGQPPTGHHRLVSSATFSGDGSTLVTADDEGTVILWDLSDRSQPRRLGKPLAGHTGSVTSVALSPEGNTLAAGGSDTTVILWDLTALNKLRADAPERACAITGRGLDRAEWDRYIPGLPYQETCHAISVGGAGLP